MKIGIVNDSALAVTALRRALAREPSLSVIWVATDGSQALQQCRSQPPDLVLMDLMMPVMDGVEATRRIMAESPCAILIVTSDVLGHTSSVFEAMGHGALDVVSTPTLAPENDHASSALLLRKIRNVGWLIAGRKGARATADAPLAPARARVPLLAIGASAGGPATLAALLADLPVDFSAAIVMVQHVDAAFAEGMATWLDGQCGIAVRLAREGDVPTPGVALLAGTNDHIKLGATGTLYYDPDPRDYLYRPSIDVFFESVVSRWRSDAVGVLLTGMGRDGASGLKRMRDHGFHTIAQDQETSAVYGMPKAAAALGAAVEILPIDRIAAAVIARIKKGEGDARRT